ncbi:MAG: DUF805 domain-containing protein [Streptococcaceae bacterium]|jgi:uncharacterized membrane protein YhaH (DUF805 family)|nr:DUF805 domain-containing protein [Streptococcaceae bacterium]
MLEAYKKFWKGYVDFGGRSTRADYWWTFLCNGIIGLVLYILFIISGGLAGFFAMTNVNAGATTSVGITGMAGGAIFFFILMMLFSLATIIPWLALEVRRLRDANFHWAFIFFNLGLSIVVFILNQFPTKDGEYNQK